MVVVSMKERSLFIRVFDRCWRALLTMSVVTSLFVAQPAVTAIQGSAGNGSEAQILLRFTFNPSYQISRVDDIVIEVSNLDETVTHKERLCIRGPVNSNYTITANTEQYNIFAVQDNTGNLIPFQVYFYKTLNTPTPDRLLPGQRSKAYEITQTKMNCDGEDNSAIEVLIEPKYLKEAKVGEYNGVLVLTVGSL